MSEALLISRSAVEQVIELSVGLLDTLDPDPELEDATDLEDDFALSAHAVGYATGPGCEVTDTGENAWVEWDKMRGAQKRGHNLTAGHEDAEDDDPDHGLDEGEPNYVAKSDGAPGCPISDNDYEHDGQEPEDGT